MEEKMKIKSLGRYGVVELDGQEYRVYPKRKPMGNDLILWTICLLGAGVVMGLFAGLLLSQTIHVVTCQGFLNTTSHAMSISCG